MKQTRVVLCQCLIAREAIYLQDMLKRYIPKRTLRSIDALQLKVPRFKNETLGTRTFAYAAGSLWNSLLVEIRAADNVSSFNSLLKTYLFELVYNIL